MKELVENWGELKSALLSGLTESKKKIVAPLLENQKMQMIEESAQPGSVDTSSIAGFRKIMLPMIRRVIPGTIGTELVGVQPMTGPVGLIYSMRYTYNDPITGTQQNNIDNTTSPYTFNGIDGGFGDMPSSQTDREAFGNLNLIRRFYSGSTRQDQTAGTLGYGGASAIAGANAYGEGWGSDANHSAYSTLSSLDSVGNPVGAAGPLYGGGGGFLEGSAGRRMGMNIVTQAVEAKSRKLQAAWTIEAMQDLNNQHGLDMESELVNVMGQELIQEIDNEIITDLLSIAGTVSAFDGSVPATAGYYKPTFVGDRLANLAVQINYVANEIARKTRKGGANFIVVSPMIVSVLQTAAKSAFAPTTQGDFQAPVNTKLVGTLNGKIKVYSYLWNAAQTTDIGGNGDDIILVGYKGGDGETDSGYFYCPYIPLQSSGIIMNPATTQPMISLMTRYGKAILTNKATSLGNSADYYGKINVSNLSLL